MGFVRQSLLAATVCLGSLAVTANAAPLRWTFHDTTSLGSNITGSFVYDADANTYSHIDIRTDSGSIIPNQTWQNLTINPSGAYWLQIVDTDSQNQTGANVLVLFFLNTLTNAGGTSYLAYTYQGVCDTATCGRLNAYPHDPSHGWNLNATGYLVASAIPEPASLSMLAAGAGAIFLTRKRRARLTAAA